MHLQSIHLGSLPVFPNALPSVSEVHPLPGDHHLSLKMNAYTFLSLASSLPCPVLGARQHFKNIYLISLEQGEEAKADVIHSSAPAATSFPKVNLAEFCTHLSHSCRLFLHGVCAFNGIHCNVEHTVCLHWSLLECKFHRKEDRTYPMHGTDETPVKIMNGRLGLNGYWKDH